MGTLIERRRPTAIEILHRSTQCGGWKSERICRTPTSVAPFISHHSLISHDLRNFYRNITKYAAFCLFIIWIHLLGPFHNQNENDFCAYSTHGSFPHWFDIQCTESLFFFFELSALGPALKVSAPKISVWRVNGDHYDENDEDDLD